MLDDWEIAETLRAIEDAGSYSRAGSVIDLTRQALMYRVKVLEARLGERVVESPGPAAGTRLTPAGRTWLEAQR